MWIVLLSFTKYFAIKDTYRLSQLFCTILKIIMNQIKKFFIISTKNVKYKIFNYVHTNANVFQYCELY